MTEEPNSLIVRKLHILRQLKRDKLLEDEVVIRIQEKIALDYIASISEEESNFNSNWESLISAMNPQELSAKKERSQVFISYSHKDKEWLQKFQIMLKPAIRNQKITVWDDTRISTGSKWRDEIKKALDAAKLAVLMVSPNFLASDFIAEHELPPLLKAAEKEGVKIIWIYLSDCMYELTEIENYQAAHDISCPLDGLNSSKLNSIIKMICKQILTAADEVLE